MGGEKEKLLCCSVDEAKPCRVPLAKPDWVEVWKRLWSGVEALCGNGDPLTWGFVPFQVVVLVTVGFVWVFFRFFGKVNMPGLKLTESKCLCLQSVI